MTHLQYTSLRTKLDIFNFGKGYKHYTELPKNYKDSTGLPFGPRDLEFSEVIAVFGPKTSTARANKLLRILHGRRIAGTLDEPSVQVNTDSYHPKEIEIALEYLRKNAPVDEIINAGLRAEEELAKLELETQHKAEVAADAEALETAGNKEGEEQASNNRDKLYGKGTLDKIRERNIKRAQEREKEREQKKREREEKRQKELEARAKELGGKVVVWEDGKTRVATPKMQEYIDRATDKKDVPEMSKWERLLPATIVVLLYAAILHAIAYFYEEPLPEDRLIPDIPASVLTVGALIGANLLVWGAWKLPPLWRVLNRYFIVVPAVPRPLAFILTPMSHQHFGKHMFWNMVFLGGVGYALHEDVGRATFLATYLSGGSFAFLATHWMTVLRSNWALSTLGASGGLYAIGIAYFWSHAMDRFKIFGLPPDPAEGIHGLVFAGLLMGLNVAGMMFGGHIFDVVSHNAGVAFGLFAGTLMKWKRESQQAAAAAAAAADRLDDGVVRSEAAVAAGTDKPREEGGGKASDESETELQHYELQMKLHEEQKKARG